MHKFLFFNKFIIFLCRSGSVVGIETGYGLDGPGIESRYEWDFPPDQTGPGTLAASCKIVSGCFPGVNSGRGVTLTPHHFLVTWSRKIRAIPLIPLWAARPIQSLSVCARVHILWYSSTCFEHCCAYHQEVKLYYTESGIVTLCRWPSGAQVAHRTAIYRVWR